MSGRTAVVIGATSGIGLAIARGLAEAGADVVATGRRQQLVDAAASSIEGLGRRTLRVASDVTSTESIQALRDACVKTFGRVDILVNAAGITTRAPSLEMPESRWTEIMETNFTGTLRRRGEPWPEPSPEDKERLDRAFRSGEY